VAGALGVLLGPWGVHRFYLGFVGIGVVQIVVTLVTCGVGGLWGFVEGILCFCGAMRDIDGLPLRS
jgi:TM2 domain-containing membrane protein YozV